MSWMQRLYDTYEQATKLDLPQDQRIPPIRHTIQNAHINIVLNEKAEFVRATVLRKYQVILPATEDSEARSSNEAPHGLADKIQYVAKDYPSWGGGKKHYFESYSDQLRLWCEAGAPNKVQIIYKYVSKGTVIADLVQAQKILCTSENNLIEHWPKERQKEGEVSKPELFESLPVKTDKKILSDAFDEFEIGDALICWSVQIFEEVEPDTWNDPEVHSSWISYLEQKDQTQGFCYILGEKVGVARKHPAKLRHNADTSKLISSNDTEGYTFKGRFLQANQGATISSDVTQKAHSALGWLIKIRKQAVQNERQYVIAWAISEKYVLKTLNPVDDWSHLEEEEDGSTVELMQLQETIKNSNDLGHRVVQNLKTKLYGYKRELQGTEQLSLMIIDSATTKGAMSVSYYREFLLAEYFESLNLWYEQFAWYQRVDVIGWFERVKKVKLKGKLKLISPVFWPQVPPAPSEIVQAAFGAKPSDDLKKQVFRRVLACIAEGYPFPQALMEAVVHNASRPHAFETWEWERNLGVACALYKGFYARHTDLKQRKDFSMNIDANTGRAYSFGRLLAIADEVEKMSNKIAKETRTTTAMRLMQRFSAQPMATWKNIEESLHPYFMRIQSKYPPLVDAYKDLIGQEMEKLYQANKFNNEALDGEYLLGYHLQRRWFDQHKYTMGQWVSKDATEEVAPLAVDQ